MEPMRSDSLGTDTNPELLVNLSSSNDRHGKVIAAPHET